ncbi:MULTISPECIES: SH3 domain-containing protein [Pseudoalteromonas]|uniref:SH3 domain-containing protein n=1 Tax=Pseudoalteromonas TaxID=53246 RepID=UPI0012FDBEF4|nr:MULTISPECIES: SH3 domain-containing protein [Pseudoalteromonas]
MYNLDGLTEIQSASGYLPAIVQQNVNVRTSPNRSSNKLGLLAGGTTVQAEFSLDSDWAKVYFDNQNAYIHKSALIKQQYKADIHYSIKSNESAVFSMSGWHYPHLPGSYFLNYQSNKFGHASFGPLAGSGISEIDTKLFKIKHPDTNAYLITTHISGSRSYYTSYLAIVNKLKLTVFQLPTHTTTDQINYSIEDGRLAFTGKSFHSCCDYDALTANINLETLSYTATQQTYTLNDSGETKAPAPENIPLTINEIKLAKSTGL